MRRREFMTLFGGALLGGVVSGWPIAARARQSRSPVIGFQSRFARPELGVRGRLPRRPCGSRLRARPERNDRISLGEESALAVAAACGRTGRPSRGRDCGHRFILHGPGGEGRHFNDSNRLCDCGRPGAKRTCYQPQSAWRHPHGGDISRWAACGQKTQSAARAGPACRHDWLSFRPGNLADLQGAKARDACRGRALERRSWYRKSAIPTSRLPSRLSSNGGPMR